MRDMTLHEKHDLLIKISAIKGKSRLSEKVWSLSFNVIVHLQKRKQNNIKASREVLQSRITDAAAPFSFSMNVSEGALIRGFHT